MKEEIKKKSSPILRIIIIILFFIALIAILAYYIYLNLPRDPQQLEVTTPPIIQQPGTSSVNQFYPNMKFNHIKITYRINEDCDNKKRINMGKAFNELSTKVPILTFFESNLDPDIEISCTETNKINIDKKHFVAGEGGAKEIIQTERYNIITEGIILLYENKKARSKTCDYPSVELHELLHVLGFDHSEDRKSIMYPFIESCDQILDLQIIEQLRNLYAEENLADVYFDYLDVTKKGRYIDFNLTIKNSGSIKSEDVTLTILDGLDVIEQKKLGEIDFGAGVTLTTTNLKLKRLNPDQINFILDKENKIKEINEDNNVGNIKLGN
tara:strand:+ start:112 stop:1089 length:978 start_codon:yes stop_codon:yes gene_type:complete